MCESGEPLKDATMHKHVRQVVSGDGWVSEVARSLGDEPTIDPAISFFFILYFFTGRTCVSVRVSDKDRHRVTHRQTDTQTHIHAQAQARARTHAHTRTRTHTHVRAV